MTASLRSCRHVAFVACVIAGACGGLSSHDSAGAGGSPVEDSGGAPPDAGSESDATGGGGVAGSVSDAAGASGTGGTAPMDALGTCDTGQGGVAGAFYDPNKAFCIGRTPVIADIKGFPAYKPQCTGANPVCGIVDCDATTEPLFCCGGKTPVCKPCPPGMVSSGSSCIDQREVSRGEYEAWLATNPKAYYCSNFEPDPACMKQPSVCAASCNQHPQVCVSYCQASGYCASRGLLTCKVTQLSAACGGTSFPYGNTYDPAACNGADMSVQTTIAVGSKSQCASSTFGGMVYDLSGNVAELTTTSPAGFAAFGGSFESAQGGLQCTSSEAVAYTTVSPTLGFRCCTVE